jgi:DNA-binding CsgD family transcriptional regulator
MIYSEDWAASAAWAGFSAASPKGRGKPLENNFDADMGARRARVFMKQLWSSRDELSPRNFRKEKLLVFLVFPLAIIIGDLRYLDLDMTLFGFESPSLMLAAYALGWLLVMAFPKARLPLLLRVAAVVSAVFIPFQVFLEPGVLRLWFFLLFHVMNGVCIAVGFCFFCFSLNNVERLFAAAIAQVYYALVPDIFWGTIGPFMKTWGSAAAMLALLAVVFLFRPAPEPALNPELAARREGKSGSAVPLILAVDMIYVISNLMTYFIDFDYELVIPFLYGTGALAAVAAVFVLQLLFNKSAMHSWSLFLILLMVGYAALLFESPFLINAGSFATGLGDGLGYVVIMYLIGGALKREGNPRMFRLLCLVTFFEYFVVTLGFDLLYATVEAPSKHIAFAVVFLLSCLCLGFAPALQKRLFDADWTDSLHALDVIRAEYPAELASVEQIDRASGLGLTPRETEIFTLLLTDMNSKEIFSEMKISRGTYNFHTKNLYRKLSIQSRTELFAKHGKQGTQEIMGEREKIR